MALLGLRHIEDELCKEFSNKSGDKRMDSTSLRTIEPLFERKYFCLFFVTISFAQTRLGQYCTPETKEDILP
jgi:hypothetical protein